MKKILQKIISLLFLLMVGISGEQFAQTNNEYPKEVIVQSWKKGKETFKNLKFDLILSSENKELQKEVVGDSGKKYKLIVNHNPYFDQQLEHWRIELYEILSKKGDSEEKLSPNLFTLEPNEVGKHIFPKEDYIGVLFPRETPYAYFEDDEPMYGEGYAFYYIKTIRKINIENFCVIIKVGDYKFNQRDKNKLDSLQVFIEFTSACSGVAIATE